MQAPSNQQRVKRLAAIAAKMQQIAADNRRDSLAEKISRLLPKLRDTTAKIVVVGQFKQGKSSLVNALVSAQVCPVDDVVATSVPTLVRWGEEITATLVTEFADSRKTVRMSVDPQHLRAHVTEAAG